MGLGVRVRAARSASSAMPARCLEKRKRLGKLWYGWCAL